MRVESNREYDTGMAQLNIEVSCRDKPPSLKLKVMEYQSEALLLRAMDMADLLRKLGYTNEGIKYIGEALVMIADGSKKYFVSGQPLSSL